MASMRKMKGSWYARIVVYLGYYMLNGKKKQQQKEILIPLHKSKTTAKRFMLTLEKYEDDIKSGNLPKKKYGVKQKKVDILSMNFFRYLYKRNEDSNYGQWSHEKFGEVGTNSYQREIELFDMISEMSNYHDLVSLLYVDGNLSTFSMWSSLPNSAVYSGMSKETKQRNIEISKLCQ